MSGPRFSWINIKNNWNWWNSSPDVQVSGEVSKRPNEGWSKDGDIEVNHAGVDAGIEFLKGEMDYANKRGTITLTGPSTGVDVGLKSSVNNTGLSAMAELSAAKCEVTYGPLYVSGNLNSNTGLKVGTGGVQAAYLGFGLTLGIGGRWTIDTPFGSGGFSPGTGTGTMIQTNAPKRRTMKIEN